MNNKRIWCFAYGETCLKASAKEINSNKLDNERRSGGNKIDLILSLREDNEEFSVAELSGPVTTQVWSHFLGDSIKIMKMLKILMNRFAGINPQGDIRLIKLYGMQSYCKWIILKLLLLHIINLGFFLQCVN
jgi:hypothetical protein